MVEAAEMTRADFPLEISDPERIPTARYYDADFYRRECEELWPHVWQMACRVEQVPEVGDWIEYSNLGKSVIIVRTKDGIRAYHNACRHRGVPLTEGSHGNCKGKGFICPFHGWRWNIEGKNTFVYGRHMFSEHQLDEQDLALRPCRTEIEMGCVFINFDDEAPSLREQLGPLAIGLEAYNADKMRAEWCFGTVLPANWKIAMEAFMEGYHVMRTHPQLQQKVPILYNMMYGMDTGGIGVPINPNRSMKENIEDQVEHMQLLSDGMAGMCHAKDVAVARTLIDVELPEDPGQAIMQWFGMVNHFVTQAGQARGEPTPDLNKIAVETPVKSVEFIFPNYFLLPFLSSMAAYRIRPLGPESCMFELWSLTHFPEGQEPPVVMEPVMLPYDSDQFPMIPRQDYSNIPIQQKGMHAEGFDFMRLSKDIEGLISNYQRIIDGYLNGVSPDKLVAGTQKLAGNFDGPIVDLGF
ncbi:phenylpropionate dioxygenase-like ring-hydroxylating dioxygenase large terminal subunit [Sphingobium scionense]|uniref:Phenylpropionate dioxygenase-like ring-hydroxylating dioxygenase large terminal subunit n=2 Tax=Sphingobium scionense TaxID=1404341 RepID=A0A7W6LNM8_9SPHN|nr:phenylpropionate dioxygenase-like ring-hydroxylating dioxygenase large terminal subunit [Sphingobium scionense]